jgi:hypothetical protein
MSTTMTSSRLSYVQWLTESRPPSLTWPRPSRPQPNVRVSLVKAGWTATQQPGLPNALE